MVVFPQAQNIFDIPWTFANYESGKALATALQQVILMLPFGYLLCNFTPVLQMHDGYPRFSELFVATLAVYLCFAGGSVGIGLPLSKLQAEDFQHRRQIQ